MIAQALNGHFSVFFKHLVSIHARELHANHRFAKRAVSHEQAVFSLGHQPTFYAGIQDSRFHLTSGVLEKDVI